MLQASEDSFEISSDYGDPIRVLFCMGQEGEHRDSQEQSDPHDYNQRGNLYIDIKVPDPP